LEARKEYLSRLIAFCAVDVYRWKMTLTEKRTEEDQSINALKSDWNSLYIAGEWVDRGNRPAIKDYDPYTEKIIVEVPSATTEDVESI
jgi:hypothetical protein